MRRVIRNFYYYYLSLKLSLKNKNQATPITITNNQNQATPAPFQQLLVLNLSNIISSPSQLLNLLFTSDMNGQNPLYAWVEQYSGLDNVRIWVKLPNGVPANGTTTIYMWVKSSNQYPYTGISPITAQALGLTWGAFDNGSNIFMFYNNGTFLYPEKRTGTGGSGPSLTTSAPAPYPYAITGSVNGGTADPRTWTINAQLPPPNLPSAFIAQMLVYLTGTGPAGSLLTNVTGLNGNFYVFSFSDSENFMQYVSSSTSSALYLCRVLAGSKTNTWYQMTAINNNDKLSFYQSTSFNLNNFGTLQCGPINGVGYTGGGIGVSANGTGTAYFTMILARAYPPNGVMPSVT